MLHLQDQVVQFALYGQRSLRGDLQALFWVIKKKMSCMCLIIEPVAPPQQLLIAFACPILDFKAVRRSCWRHMQCLRAVSEEVEEVAQWFKEELEPCK